MRKTISVVLSAAMAFAVVACGDSDAEGGGSGTTSIKATVKDFEFSPTKWTVPAGEKITLELINDGSVTHEWVLLQSGVKIDNEKDLPATEEELLADFVYWEHEVEAGKTEKVTFTAPEAGTYQIVCAIDTHFDAGMEGQLVST